MKTPATSVASPETRDAMLAATLPHDETALFERGRGAQAQFHAAMLAGDDATARAAAELLDAISYRLNGDTRFGCATEEGGATRLGRALREPDGVAPGWCAEGRFVVEHPRMRVLVTVRPAFGWWMHHAEYRVIDRDRPFLSETGYRSDFWQQPYAGLTPAQVAEQRIASLVAERGGYVMVGSRVTHGVACEGEGEDEDADTDAEDAVAIAADATSADWIGARASRAPAIEDNGQTGFDF